MVTITCLILMSVVTGVLPADPLGCTYDSSEKTYTCSARSWSLPLAHGDFDNVVQQLYLTDVNGGLSSGGTFSGFSSINTNAFDSSKVPLLAIRCTSGGSLIMYAGTFGDMSWVKEFRIQDCNVLSLPDNVFQDFGDINLFQMSGGSVTGMGFNALNGLNVQRMTGVPEPSGTFAIQNCQVVPGGLPNGMLYPLVNATTILLENTGMRVLQKDMFQASTKMQRLSLSYNPFTYLQAEMFDQATSLTTLELHGIDWACTCTNIWPATFAEANNITLKGGYVCGSPTAYQYVRGQTFNKEQCLEVDICNGKPGIAMGSSCMYIWDLMYFGFLLVATVVGCTAFGMVIHSKRQIAANASPEKKRPPMGGRKLSGSQWKKLGVDEKPRNPRDESMA